MVVNVTDNESTNEELVRIARILDIIFSVIISLNMFLWFFSLMSSTGANIIDQSKEIGILRWIGYTKFKIKRIYFYETFVLVFSSSTLGILVGTFVGWTMTQQQSQFILIPIQFYFPYKHLIVTMIISIIWSFIAVISPTTYILSKEISEIFRMN